MRLSTRNQLKGTITEVDLGSVMAIVKGKLDGGERIVTSSVTKDAALDLALKGGQPATVFIKSPEVTVAVEYPDMAPTMRAERSYADTKKVALGDVPIP